MKKELMRKWIPVIAAFFVLLGLSVFLLKKDAIPFWTWWMLSAFLGMVGMPVTGTLFSNFEDRGWAFSKVLSIALTGFFTWFLVAAEVLPFTVFTCIGVVLGFVILNFLVFKQNEKKAIDCLPENVMLICIEELIFIAVFLMWTYLAGFHPQAYGTEKFMDYGFMEAMMRSTELPARDLWYSEGGINYYYGGQYFAVFLTKLTGSRVEITYNLMRTFVAAFAFFLPFSLVYQMVCDIPEARKKYSAIPAGILAGIAVSIAGNMHYVIYSKILPMIQKIRGEEVSSYWFPDATRYIGHNPDVPDKTIHEFPCYSFVLGDLHAHVVNVMFVLLVTGILYTWMKKIRTESVKLDLKAQLQMPHLILLSILLGMFQWSNYWDFVIYFVVVGGVVLFANIIQFKGNLKWISGVTALQAVEVLVISYLSVLPFTLKFETMIQGIALAQYHSRFYQLMVLWGLPSILVLVYLGMVLWENISRKKVKNLYQFMEVTSIPDLFAVITGLCAMGLVLIPEIVYVRDIYEQGNARANTMFKLTYQAYILFGMTMVYVMFRIWNQKKYYILKGVCALGCICLLWTVGYFGNSVKAWFGDVLHPQNYQGLNALTYLETDFSEDADAIRWLKNNVQGVEVVLEANGDSYSGFERVSAATGLPTILGWYVHEWLWRNDVADLNRKSADIETIYTSEDAVTVRELIEEYEVSYIFVGAKEREKYAERLNENTLQSMGEIVFSDENSATYIIKVN